MHELYNIITAGVGRNDCAWSSLVSELLHDRSLQGQGFRKALVRYQQSHLLSASSYPTYLHNKPGFGKRCREIISRGTDDFSPLGEFGQRWRIGSQLLDFLPCPNQLCRVLINEVDRPSQSRPL
jgi:hypothetical protein